MVSFSQKQLRPRPDKKLIQNFRRASPPLSYAESPPPPWGRTIPTCARMLLRPMHSGVKKHLQRLIKQREKGCGVQYFDWPIPVFIRFIRKNHDYYCKLMNESYMTWRGKVWLLRKIDKDYTMIIIRHVCSLLEAPWLWLYEWGAPHVLSQDNLVHVEVFQ